MNWKESIAIWLFLLMCSWSTTSMPFAVRTCEVHPKDVVAAAGERVSLNCSASAGLSVVSWQLGADVLTKIVVYTAPVYRSDGSIRTEKFVATERGYTVDDTKESEAILEINQTSIAHAGAYYCTCSDDKMTAALGAVVVIEPKLSKNASVCSGEPVAINCNITSSEDISYDIVLERKDALGNTVARKNGSSSCKDCVAPSFVIIANETLNETFICTVNATTKKNIQFSKVLKTSIEYSKDCSENPDTQNSTEGGSGNWITITVCCVLVVSALLAFALLMFLRQRRRRKGYTSFCST